MHADCLPAQPASGPSRPPSLETLSRRQFLQLAGAGFLARLVSPPFGVDDPFSKWQARVAYSYGVRAYSKPSTSAETLRAHGRDELLTVVEVVLAEAPAHNRIWYRVAESGYIHSGGLQPVRTQFQEPLEQVPQGGALVELTVPFTDVRARPGFAWAPKYRYYYSSTFWVGEVVRAEDGKAWYRIEDDRTLISYWGLAQHFRPIAEGEFAPLSAGVEAAEKHIEVDLGHQWVIAYEGETPVFMSRASTGYWTRDGQSTTPLGRHATFYKRPSRHMAAGDLAGMGYDLPGVPWVSYFTTTGVSFHGTYWHNDFGQPRSHGCVNLPPEAARWLYRWSTPAVPPGERLFQDTTGTRVLVH